MTAGQRVEFRDVINHFPVKVSRSLARFVTETALKSSRYLFIKTAKGIQSAYCTYCKKQHFPETKLKHKQLLEVQCPHCKSKCKVRAAGLGRKYMMDRAVVVWYEKSLIDNETIVARVIEVRRDYSGDYTKVETEFSTNSHYVFQPGKSMYFGYERIRSKVGSAFDEIATRYGANCPRFMSIPNIRRAVKGTPFQYSTWDQYTKYKNPHYVSDMVEFFDIAARYPCVEYLTKIGFKDFVWAKLYRDQTYGAIYWQGNTLMKVLRLSKVELREIRDFKIELSPIELRFYQYARKKSLPVTLRDAKLIGAVYGGHEKEYYKAACAHESEDIVVKYILKQMRKEHYVDERVYNMLSDWRDYRKQCVELGMSLEEDRYLFPNDLHKSHNELTKRIRLKNDKAIDLKIQRRAKGLKKYMFQKDGFQSVLSYLWKSCTMRALNWSIV
ncbi:PcfJ domain-containing protein [Paenibacillus sp. DCT19]|uniref:PcfJ domain-containing protein n=1 Tax=Paenibacillus sp. DCT19 TaxID=2211212 RepID=UPI000FE1BDD3|nr:PcfJ domain-containing protein [Paenibacillus sp. DCT19]